MLNIEYGIKVNFQFCIPLFNILCFQAVAKYHCLPGFYNYGYGKILLFYCLNGGHYASLCCVRSVYMTIAENTTVLYSTCQLNGTWSDVSLTCMAIPGYNGEFTTQAVTVINKKLQPQKS